MSSFVIPSTSFLYRLSFCFTAVAKRSSFTAPLATNATYKRACSSSDIEAMNCQNVILLQVQQFFEIGCAAIWAEGASRILTGLVEEQTFE
jgi:hypothetical protein